MAVVFWSAAMDELALVFTDVFSADATVVLSAAMVSNCVPTITQHGVTHSFVSGLIELLTSPNQSLTVPR